MPLLWNDDFSIGVKIIDKQHKQFLSVLSKLIDSVGKPESDEEIEQEYKEDKITSSFNLADFLEEWLGIHLNGMDKKYVKCFHEHGLF